MQLDLLTYQKEVIYFICITNLKTNINGYKSHIPINNVSNHILQLEKYVFMPAFITLALKTLSSRSCLNLFKNRTIHVYFF